MFVAVTGEIDKIVYFAAMRGNGRANTSTHIIRRIGTSRFEPHDWRLSVTASYAPEALPSPALRCCRHTPPMPRNEKSQLALKIAHANFDLGRDAAPRG